jgi:hypothetical protein
MAKDKTEVVNTGSHDGGHISVADYGNPAGVRDSFGKSTPDDLLPTIMALRHTDQFAQSLADRLDAITGDLAAAWSGANADDALQIVNLLKVDAGSISSDVAQVAHALDLFHQAWVQCQADASTLGDDEVQRSHDLFDAFTHAMDQTKWLLPDQLVYHDPLSQQTQSGLTPPGGGTGNGLGTGPTLPGFGDNVTGGTGLGGLDPNGSGIHHAGFGGIGSGGGSSLAGVGLGHGAGGSTTGGASGLGADGFGAGGGGAGAGIGAGAGGGATGSGAGGSGFLPPAGGGGGSGNDEKERERTTWLDEDDDIWGGDDAPSNVIT